MPDLILQQFNCENGLELVIDTQTGECFASQRALARMCGRNESTIRSWIGARRIEPKQAKVPTATGLQTSAVLDESAILAALAKYRPEMLTPYALLVKGITGRIIDFPPIPNNKKMEHRRKKGYIYLFGNEQILKLGFSTNPQGRLAQLQRWQGELEVLLTIEGTLTQEQSFHSILHQTGEYFGDEWYPVYRKHEILSLLGVLSNPTERVRSSTKEYKNAILGLIREMEEQDIQSTNP